MVYVLGVMEELVLMIGKAFVLNEELRARSSLSFDLPLLSTISIPKEDVIQLIECCTEGCTNYTTEENHPFSTCDECMRIPR